MIGRVLTRGFEIETRQYDLLKVDLGEGLNADFVYFGLLPSIAWGVLLSLIFGFPSSSAFMLYFGLPITISYIAFQPDPKRARRKRITGWILAARYLLVGCWPVVNAQRVKPSHNRVAPIQGQTVSRTIAGVRRQSKGIWETGSDSVEHVIEEGSDIAVNSQARLYSFNSMSTLRNRYA